MLKPYVVATNSNYALVVLAVDEEDAIDTAIAYTLDKYDEDRNDWVAYDLVDYLDNYGDWDGVWELPTC